MYKNDGEMRKRLFTATVKEWRVWQGRQMLPFVAATTSKLVLEIYVLGVFAYIEILFSHWLKPLTLEDFFSVFI